MTKHDNYNIIITLIINASAFAIGTTTTWGSRKQNRAIAKFLEFHNYLRK